MIRPLALVLCASLAACTGTFGSVGRSTRISDSARVTATSIVPDDASNRGVVEHLALAEEIYSKTLDALRERRNALRSRRRALTLTSYATFAATTLVISAAAIDKANNGDTMTSTGGLRTVGYGALGGLGLGTTLEVMNLMQEDPSSVEAKINHLQSSYDNMTDRLRTVFEEATTAAIAVEGQPAVKPNSRALQIKASPIIEAFISEALQINVKG
ncbi:MAG: hypothetical protein WKG01_21310 [Kofleriaceae bacterium]